MSAITALGFFRTRLDERLASLVASVKAIFGEDIDLDPDSIDGETISIYAEGVASLDALAEDTFNSFNPQTATGAGLSRLVQLNGIKRIAGAYSVVTLTVSGASETTIPIASLVRTDTGNITFETTAEVIIGAGGTAQVPARSVNKGAIAAPAGTITKIDSPIYGWHGVTNANDATIGRGEESDEALRIRRRRSTVTPAQGLPDSLLGALLNIPDVLKAEVFENFEGTTDGNGQQRNSVYCVVDGGAVQTILDTIWLKKGFGCTILGAVSGDALDIYGKPHTMKFSRPTDIDIYMIVNLHTKTGWPGDGIDQMKAAIVAWATENQNIGAEAIQSRLYEPVNSIPGHSVDSIFIGTSASPTTTTNIAITYDEIARFALGRIIVNVST